MTSDLREYLNGKFYNDFDEDERARIITVINKNPANQYHGTEGGADTEDSIFALSIADAIEYMGSGELGSENAIGHMSDQYDSEHQAYDASGEAARWYLRSPGANSDRIAIVDFYGAIDVGGDSMSSYLVGIRPAMWIKTN